MGVPWKCSVLSSWTDGGFQLPYRYECRREGCDSHGHIRGGQSLPHLRGKAACGGGEVGGAYAEVTNLCAPTGNTFFCGIGQCILFWSPWKLSDVWTWTNGMCVVWGKGVEPRHLQNATYYRLVPTDTCPIATAGHCSMMEASVMGGRSLGDQPGQRDRWGKVQALPMPVLLCFLLSSSTIHLPRSLST